MEQLQMMELVEEIELLGIPATYEMSGGNCGTIYIGKADADGFYDYAVGPSYFSTGIAYSNDFYWGIDGAETCNSYEESIPFTPKELARVIVESMKVEVK